MTSRDRLRRAGVVAAATALSVLAACAEPDDAPGTADAGADASDDTSADATSDAVADAAVPEAPDWDPAAFTPPPPPVPRLNRAQLVNSLHDILGDDVVVPPFVEPDVEEAFFATVGAGLATVSPRGVENLEQISYAVAGQVADPARVDRLPCVPDAVDDAACLATLVDHYGLRLWRRPLAESDRDRFVTVGLDAAAVLDDPLAGVEFAVAGLLMSPDFIFRRELGVDDPETGWRAYTDWEMASRLSFTLWNTSPDEALIEAAAAGELTDPVTLEAHVDRMLEDERAHEGVREMFSQLYRLHELDHLNKDPTLFDHFDPSLGESAREETLRLIESLVFEERADFRDLLTTNRTFVDNRLAAVYGIPSPSRDGFAETFLPPDMGRRGLTGQVSFLALAAHPVSSSATLRGKFVRERLLCEAVPAPPANANTAIPEPSPDAPTLRDRVAVHLENEDCATCHLIMDPIGLGFENFDGIGRWRDTDNGAEIDTTGDLDGAEFVDAWDMADTIRQHPGTGPCVARMTYRYASGVREGRNQFAVVDTLSAFYEATGYDVYALLRAVVLSPAFRYAGPITD